MKNYLVILLALCFSCAHHKAKNHPAHHVSSPSKIHEVGLINNPDNLILFNLIREAKKTIDIEIYEMKDDDFQELLLEKLKAGVKVRIVKDPFTVGDTCDELAGNDVLPKSARSQSKCLEEKNYVREFIMHGGRYVYFNKDELCGIPGKNCFQHGKMVIIDQKTVLLSTGNFNSSSLCNMNLRPSACNRDYSYVTSDPSVVELLSSVYDHDFKGHAYNLKSLMEKSEVSRLTISPFSREPLVNFINQSKKKILIQNQYLEEPAWNEALINAAQRGVEVKVMVSDFCHFGEASENKQEKIKDIYSAFERAGIKTKTFTAKIKIRNRRGYLHAKAIVIDDKQAWIGSVNGSSTSTIQNREFGIFFKQSQSVKKLIQIMENDFDHDKALTWKQSLACEK